MVDVLAFSPHPDDAEIGCAGALLLAAKRGVSAAVVDLSDGGRATRGTAETRRLECAEATKLLGLVTRGSLGFPDTQITDDEASVQKVVEVLRELRPRVVLAPHVDDRHPDHRATASLVRRAVFLAAVAKAFGGPAHRVGALIHYMIHGPFEPSFVIDISAVWGERCRVLDAYGSQFSTAHGANDEPTTALSHPSFRDALDARAVHYGAMIGVARGEPYWQRGPLSVRGLSDLLTADPDSGYRTFS